MVLSLKKAFSNLVLALLFILLFSFFPAALADRGIIPIDPGVSVYEPGQKAIVAWNGEEEILILSTDVNAGANTYALEVMPLPSNPKAIEPASFESFVHIQNLIWNHAPQVLGRYYGGKEQTQGIEVTFHEKIGAHDITVVKASDATELTEWADNFLEENGISQIISLRNFESVIEDYMARGFRHFVLDLIETSSQEKSVEPILYRFKTSFLYYPLKISSPVPGDTEITLFVLTNNKIHNSFSYSFYPLRMAYYRSGNHWAPIQFNLTKGELSIIDLRIGRLFEENAWLTVLEYEGQMKWLKIDLMIAQSSGTPSNQGDSSGHAVYVLLGVGVGALCTLLGAALIFLVTRTKRTKQ